MIRGHDVTWVAEHGPGQNDSDILDLADQQDRVLLTFDLDFGELVHRLGEKTKGVILLRLRLPDTLLNDFKTAWPQIERKALGHFIVVTRSKIRIRPL